jgi:ADP-ribosyl-[dinitrogen reductase] hydrolase
MTENKIAREGILPVPISRLQSALGGLLLGIATGDSIGLPAEGLSRNRIQRRWNGEWRQRLIFGHGMCSDDTEHTFLVAQALLSHPDNAAAFQRCFAWKLRLWLLGLPAGVGFASLRAILKLWLGFPPSRSGVHSAGNGPAMRSGIIGAYFFDEPGKRRQFVSSATRLTHTDPRAETAALAVAEASAWAVRQDKPLEDLVSELPHLGNDGEWRAVCTKLSEALATNQAVASFAESLDLGDGVSGYCYHSVPVVLYAWLRSPNDFRRALESALNCGGDTDTVGAIVGALAGASVGAENIPAEWLDRIWEWPRSTRVLTRVAHRLTGQKVAGHALGRVRYFWPGLIPRNLLFLITVLAHGLRRLVLSVPSPLPIQS